MSFFCGSVVAVDDGILDAGEKSLDVEDDDPGGDIRPSR